MEIINGRPIARTLQELKLESKQIPFNVAISACFQPEMNDSM